MGLYLPALAKSIKDRLRGDSTLVALLPASTSIRTTYPPPGSDTTATYPLICIWPISDTNEDPQGGRSSRVSLEVRIYVKERGNTSAEDTLLTMMKIHERVIGDWPDQTYPPPAPTYGLDRWKPSFTGYTGDAVTTYEADVLEYGGYTDASDPDGGLREWVVQFSVYMSKKAS